MVAKAPGSRSPQCAPPRAPRWLVLIGEQDLIGFWGSVKGFGSKIHGLEARGWNASTPSNESKKCNSAVQSCPVSYHGLGPIICKHIPNPGRLQFCNSNRLIKLHLGPVLQQRFLGYHVDLMCCGGCRNPASRKLSFRYQQKREISRLQNLR